MLAGGPPPLLLERPLQLEAARAAANRGTSRRACFTKRFMTFLHLLKKRDKFTNLRQLTFNDPVGTALIYGRLRR